MHLQQTKVKSRATGGPQYWFEGIPDHVRGHLQRKKACPVILQTPYGPIETPFVAMDRDHKLINGKVVRANAQHDRIQKGQPGKLIGKGEPERITNAAVRLTNGSVHTGLFHGGAFEKAEAVHSGISESYYFRLFKNSEEGFMTSKGRFVSREEAYTIAVNARQVTWKSYAGAHEDLWGERPKKGDGLGALAFNNARTANR